MALFLQESAGFGTGTVTFEEGVFALMEASDLLASFNEAVMQADFVIHEKCRNLPLAEAVALQEGLLGNAWEKLKEIGKKVWTALVNFLKSIGNKIVEIYNRVKDRLTGKTLYIRSKALRSYELQMKWLPKFESVWGKALQTAMNSTDFATAAAATEETITDASNAYASEKEGVDKNEEDKQVTVSQTFFDKLKSDAAAAAKAAEKIAATWEASVNKTLAKANADNAKVKDEDIRAEGNKANAARTMVSRLVLTKAKTFFHEVAGNITAAANAVKGSSVKDKDE